MITRRSACALLGTIATLPTAAFAQVAKLAVPSEKPILRIGGKITNTNDGDQAIFDMKSLEQLGMVTFETMTPWYTSKVRFDGVPVTKLLQAVGAKGEKLVVTALNDYATEIPIADAEAYAPILAFKRDGSYMPVTDKGPLFIVYNYDSRPELKSQKFYARSAWQVARIEVR
ncbi:MAG: molybdopterin-dependent oxidoreductase [Hyphomicrobiaceae bacterium]